MNSFSSKLHLLLAVIAALVTALPYATSEENKGSGHGGALGQGFFIPKLDLLSAELFATGAKVFESVPTKCILTSSAGVFQKDSSYYKDTKSLYTAVSTSTNIDASLKGPYTMEASVSAVTNNLAANDGEVSGSSLNLKAYSKDHTLTKDCINSQPLNKEFEADFKRLGKEIKKPWVRRSWRHYRIFVEKFGSHVVKKVITGSSIYQYAFAESSKSYSQRDFNVKACLSLAGLTNAGKVGVSACQGITNKEIKKASSMSTTEKLVIRGGTPKTRASLINSRDNNSISSFLQEGVTDPSPIVYNFAPLWKILQTR